MILAHPHANLARDLEAAVAAERGDLHGWVVSRAPQAQKADFAAFLARGDRAAARRLAAWLRSIGSDASEVGNLGRVAAPAIILAVRYRRDREAVRTLLRVAFMWSYPVMDMVCAQQGTTARALFDYAFADQPPVPEGTHLYRGSYESVHSAMRSFSLAGKRGVFFSPMLCVAATYAIYHAYEAGSPGSPGSPAMPIIVETAAPASGAFRVLNDRDGNCVEIVTFDTEPTQRAVSPALILDAAKEYRARYQSCSDTTPLWGRPDFADRVRLS